MTKAISPTRDQRASDAESNVNPKAGSITMPRTLCPEVFAQNVIQVDITRVVGIRNLGPDTVNSDMEKLDSQIRQKSGIPDIRPNIWILLIGYSKTENLKHFLVNKIKY